ncbi:MAG: D-alanine--D-alanine ligase [Calditrichia bacterium]|nr:D-alanine--D-alanine ligase [Calditrichia bacterium]
MKNKKLKIAVLLGGVSAERDVSIVTGTNIALALKENGHQVKAIDVAYGSRIFDFEKDQSQVHVKPLPPDEEKLQKLKKNIFKTINYLAENNYDLAFIALHGGYGENGQLQALLELADIPYTGAGSVSSAISMDKHTSKVLAERVGVPTANWIIIRKGEKPVFPEEIGLPLVVKPNDQGSTVGLTIVQEKEQYVEAVNKAFLHGDMVMVEEYIPGKELTVSVLNEETLPTIDIQPESGLYDYESKYQGGKTQYVVPAEIPEDVNKKVQKWAKDVFGELKCRHYGRVDFRYDPDSGKICFLELNTLPGMTSTSLVPKAAKAVGISFNEVLEKIIESVFN